MARDIPGCPGCESGHGHSHNPNPSEHTLRLAEEFGSLGDQFCREGEFREASRMYERQIEQLESAHGEASAELIPALLNAADACRSADRKGRATDLFTRALALLENNLGLKSDDPATVLELYARGLKAANNVSLSTQMYARVRTIRSRRDS